MNKNRTTKYPNIYTEEFKLSVIQEVLGGKISKEEARRQYGIKSKSAILEWTRQYSGEEGYDNRGKKLKSKQTKQKLAEQKARISELEEALRVEKLKVAINNKMIDIAETEYGIEIRKKSGAKQFKASKEKREKKSR
jgi:transposase-like protein